MLAFLLIRASAFYALVVRARLFSDGQGWKPNASAPGTIGRLTEMERPGHLQRAKRVGARALPHALAPVLSTG